MSSNQTPRSSIVDKTALAIAIASLVTSVCIAAQATQITFALDEKAVFSAYTEECISSSITAFKDANSLESGYALSPYDKANRLGDWSALINDVDALAIACRHSLEADQESMNSLVSMRNDLRDKFEAASDGSWRGDEVSGLSEWLQDFIPKLAK